MPNIVNGLGQVKVGVRIASGGGGGIDTDAQAFITAANITDTTQQNAINALVTQLKTYGIWTKLKAVYPFIGGTASSHKFNLKDPRDLDAAYRLVFNGGWTHSSTGALPNGTNAYADTKLIPSTVLTNNSSHLSYYSRTNRGLRNAYAIASYQGSPTHNTIDLRFYQNFQNKTMSAQYDGWDGLDYAGYTPTTTSCFAIASKTAVNLNKIYENGTLKGTNTYTSTKSLPNVRVLIGAQSNGSTSVSGYDILESAFASIGDGLTDTEAANFYTAVQTFQTTLGRQVGVPIVADSDAQAFLNAAVITDSTQASAINTLVTDLKTANIWTKMKALYPFVGGTATAHKFNLKDPRDLDVAYRLVFNGGWAHSSTGALPNGTTGYADTKLIPSSVLSLSSAHFSKYNRTNDLTGIKIDGAFDQNNSDAVFQQNYTSANGIIGGVSTSASYTPSDSRGLFTMSRTSNNLIKVFRNSLQIATNTSTATVLPLINVCIGARNERTAPQYYNAYETAFASIGDGLTDTEAAAFYTAVQKYQTSLGRQV
jgi:hypothetical protein